MADDVVDMDMSFLRECATSHEVVERGQEMTSALDELEEEDPVCFQCFMQTRFNHFFKETVTAQMKTMMSVQQTEKCRNFSNHQQVTKDKQPHLKIIIA